MLNAFKEVNSCEIRAKGIYLQLNFDEFGTYVFMNDKLVQNDSYSAKRKSKVSKGFLENNVRSTSSV